MRVQTAERMSATHWGALREFVRCHHLHVQVFALRLPPGFDEPLEHLRAGHLEVIKGHGGERERESCSEPHSTFGEETLT